MLFSAIALPLFATVVRAVLNPGEIDGLDANFKNAGLDGLVGQWLKPEAIMTGKFANGTKDFTVGANFTAADTKGFPSLFVNPTQNATVFKNTTLFTAMMVDAGVAGQNSTQQTLHWLINTIHVNTTGGSPFALNYDNGTTITEYAGPAPPAGSGPHRYVLMLIEQPENFTAPQAYSQQNTPVGEIDWAKYMNDTKLGNIIAANYFTVEEGQSTASISQTSAVESSTLPGYTGAAAVPTAAGQDGDKGVDGQGGGPGANNTGSGGNSSQSSPAGGSGSGALQISAAPFAAVGAVLLGAVAVVF